MARAITEAGSPVGNPWETVVRLARQLPEVDEARNYGMPALRVRKRFFAWLRSDGETLVVRVSPYARPYLLESEPDVYYITEHYLNYPSVLIRLGRIREERLVEALEESWAMVAPAGLLKNFDALRNRSS